MASFFPHRRRPGRQDVAEKRAGHKFAAKLPYTRQQPRLNCPHVGPDPTGRKGRVVFELSGIGGAMRRIILPLCLVLSGCLPAPTGDMPSRAATDHDSAMPAMKSFGAPSPAPVQRSNKDIERDFLALAFQLESGRNLPYLSRFEEPIRVKVTGAPPPTLIPDLTRLLTRLRNEAGIDVSRVSNGQANIIIQAVTRAEIRRHLPNAACFVVPNISDLSQYRAARRTRATNWSLLTKREKLAVFLPSDSSPQEVRDCLHEELAQAIGPLNDLYRLPDSVFNDDNVHTVLTGFDMLILRIYYAPELRSGMTRSEVAARLPGILARLNPAGAARASRFDSSTPRAWVRAIQTALGPGARPAERRQAANEALGIARAVGWQDHRLAFSHFALGRLSQPTDPDYAHQHFQAADRIYRRTPGTQLHRAYTASQLAAHAIRQGQPADALGLIAPHIATAQRHENAALLATLMMLQAEALEQQGRLAEAQAVRLDSLGWARYGFGADWAVRAKLREIAMLGSANGANR